MLTPQEIKKAPYPIEALFEALEDEVIKSLALNLKRQGEANDMDLYRLETLAIYQRELEAKVESAIKEAQKETDCIIKESAIKSYLDDAKRYKEAGKSLLVYEANERVQALVKRIRKQTEGEYKDLSRGLGLIDPITKKAHPLAKAYKNELDKAIFSAHLGIYSYQEASKKVIDNLSTQGISWLNFETGTRRSLTAHVHTVIRTSLGQLSNQMTEINLEDMGECYVEVSAHGGARPSHAIWQGKQFYWKDKDTSKDNNRAGYPEFISSTGYGTGEGLGGYNCRHTYYPFFPDSSTPAYTDKELKALAEETRAYQDKEYTVYEANQKLRAYERAIRKSKRKLVGYEALGNEDAFLYESVKLRLTTDEYKAFAKGVALPIKVARTQEVGYNRGISTKVQSYLEPTIPEIVKKKWSQEFKEVTIATYKELKKEGYISSSHFLGRYEERKKKKGYKEISLDEVLACLSKGANFREGNNRLVYLDKENAFCCVQNSENGELVSFIRRKTAKEEWEAL